MSYTLLKQNIELIKGMYFSTSPPKFINDIVASPSSLKDFLTVLNSSDITTKNGTVSVNYNTFTDELSARPTKNVAGTSNLVLNTDNLADINCINLINDSGDVNIAFKKYMYNLYAWYDRCSSLNWGKTYTTATVPNMSLWTGMTLDQSSTDNPVMKLSDITNAYVTRRILRLFIMLGNLYIAQKKSDDTLVNDCYQLLRSTNLAVYGSSSADLSTTVGYNLNSVIQQRLNNYKRGQLRVSTIDRIIATHKNNLKQSSTLLKDSKVAHRRQMIIEAIAVASFISIAAGAAAVVVYPMDQNSRYVGCLVVIALSIINALVMNSLRSRGTNVVERFSLASNSDINASIDEAVTYARNTLILANLLDTFRAVGNINYSMTKEANYYNDASEQLLNANLKVRSVYNISYSQDVKFGALINLLTSLSFVVAGMVTLYVSSESMVDKSPMIQKYILLLGGVISAICFAIFTLEISTRVHTDPKKIYWGKPASSILP